MNSQLNELVKSASSFASLAVGEIVGTKGGSFGGDSFTQGAALVSAEAPGFVGPAVPVTLQAKLMAVVSTYWRVIVAAAVVAGGFYFYSQKGGKSSYKRL